MIESIGEIQIGEFMIPIYLHNLVPSTEFLVCYKQDDGADPGFRYAPFIPVMRTDEYTPHTEFDEEDIIEIKLHPKAGNIKAILCSATDPVDFERIKKLINKRLNDRENKQA